MQSHLGFVRRGRWQLLLPNPSGDPARRLTHLDPQTASSPDAGEVDLSEFESSLVLVEGHDDGEWLWGIQVLDQCDAEMSEAVLGLLGSCASRVEKELPGSEESLQIAYDAVNRELAPLMANGSGISATEEQRLEALGQAAALMGEAAQLLQVPIR